MLLVTQAVPGCASFSVVAVGLIHRLAPAPFTQDEPTVWS